MATELTLIEKKRAELAKGLDENKDLFAVLPVEKQKEFQENFLEFATQDYLVSKISVREIIRFAVNISKLGLNINPAFKEVYIVPFNTKVNGNQVMLPQAIIPLNGIQEMSYKKKFFLKLYEVYKIGNDVVSEKEMTRAHQMLLKTSDPKWVDENFVGFDVVLTDMTGELPEQVKFVEMAYLKAVTKTMQDEKFKIQSWRHKAVRRAFGDFYIPRAREVDIFEKIEHINDQTLGAQDVIETSIVAKDFNELQEALTPMGITLTYNNGQAIASGNVYQNAKMLSTMGFKFANGSYSIPASKSQEATQNVAIEAPKQKQAQAKPAVQEDLLGNPIINSVDALSLYLDELGLTLGELTPNSKGEQWVKIVDGNTDGLDDKLLAIGFKNANGTFARKVDDLVK